MTTTLKGIVMMIATMRSIRRILTGVWMTSDANTEKKKQKQTELVLLMLASYEAVCCT